MWCAPEILQLGQINDKSAVYSFGVVLWELAARAEFLPEVKTKEQLLDMMNKGLMPNVPSGCPDAFGELIMNCLHRGIILFTLFFFICGFVICEFIFNTFLDANKRPSFKDIVETLHHLQTNIMGMSFSIFDVIL